MASVAYGSLPFSEQIAFFRAKRLVPTTSYLDLWEAGHDVGFMVAGANRADLVADFHAAIDKVIADGGTIRDFRRDFDSIVARYGWEYTGGRNWRTRVIYETNLRQSFNAGRWKQLQELARVRPFWIYRHSDAVEHPRPLHVSWDGKVYRHDDPWWETHFPANGWGCECSVEALNARDLKRLGKTGPDKAPPVEWQTVVVGQRSPGGPREVLTPEGIDPGFAYAPGRSINPAGVQAALASAERLPAAPAAAAADVPLARPRIRQALDDGFIEWQDKVRRTPKPGGDRYVVGAVTPPQAARATAATDALRTAPIEIRDRDLVGFKPTPVFSAADLATLPQLLRSPLAVLLNAAARQLLYLVGTSASRGRGRAVLQVALADAGANRFVAAAGADLAALRADVDAGRLLVLDGDLDA